MLVGRQGQVTQGVGLSPLWWLERMGVRWPRFTSCSSCWLCDLEQALHPSLAQFMPP